MSEFEQIASVGEIQPGESMSVIVDDTPALLIRIGDEYHVIEDACTHDLQPLEGGPIDGHEITCDRHGARFDVRTGAALCMPATEAVTTYAVEVRGNEIFAGPKAEDTSTTSSTAPSAHDSTTPPESSTVSGDVTEAASAPNGNMPDDMALIDALKQVIDPELMINVVDLGLVYNIESHDDSRVSVDMTLTSPACPAGPQIVQQAKMALERLDGVNDAEIKLTMSPPWTPERMTDDARDQLGIF